MGIRVSKKDVQKFADLYETLEFDSVYDLIVDYKSEFGGDIWQHYRLGRFVKFNWLIQDANKFNLTHTGIAIGEYYKRYPGLLEEGPSKFIEKSKQESKLFCSDCSIEGEHDCTWKGKAVLDCPNCRDQWYYEPLE